LAAANRSKTSLDGLAQIYARLAASTREAHLSSSSLLLVTETLQNTFRLSGATTQEAVNASIQLSQGFALGVLRGQDLRSVLEQNVVFGDLLAKGLKKLGLATLGTRGEVQKLAEAGRITAGVVLKAMALGMDDVNTRAAKLGQTFSQTLTISANNLKASILQLNNSLGLSEGFAAIMKVVTEKSGLLILSIGAIATALLVGFIPAVYASIVATNGLAAAFLRLSAHPIIAGIALISLAVITLTKDMDDLKSVLKFGAGELEKFGLKAEVAFLKADRALANFLGNTEEVKQDNAAIRRANEKIGLITFVQNAEIVAGILKEKREKDLLKLQEDLLKKEADRLSSGAEIIDKREKYLAALNLQYDKGKITVEKYLDALEKLDAKESRRLFLAGKKDLEQYRIQLDKVTQLELARWFNRGGISVEEFNKAVEKGAIRDLNFQLEKGVKNIKELDSELVKVATKFDSGSVLRAGSEEYIKSIGTLSHGVAGVIKETYDKLGDAFFEFTAKGKRDFAEMTQAILDDLYKVIIRAKVIGPLAQGLINYSGASSNAYVPNDVLQQRGAQPFALGGVVTGPTMFGLGSGRQGIMGEKGPEAILPLTRTSNGSLGVHAAVAPVNVNIINNSGGQVEQRETTGADGSKALDIIIHGKVKEGIASGKYDRAFGQMYGLQRRGT
jgi:tape measure domain-containing protein